jgi:hypothetical protein
MLDSIKWYTRLRDLPNSACRAGGLTIRELSPVGPEENQHV